MFCLRAQGGFKVTSEIIYICENELFGNLDRR